MKKTKKDNQLFIGSEFILKTNQLIMTKGGRETSYEEELEID